MIEKAVFYKHQGLNCAQAVIKAIAEAEGISSEQMLEAAAGFGVGMGGTMEATCGALIGANMMLGVSTSGHGTSKKSRLLYEQFAKASGASICKDLKGWDTGIVRCSCDDCVRNAVNAYCYVKNL